MSTVHLDNVSKAYDGVQVVNNVDLEIGDGEFVTILGASGSGKTTCLRLVAGFIAPNGGRILIGSRDVTRVPARRRNAGMVFQHYALFPHLTAAQNVAFGLNIRRVPAADIEKRTQDALRLVHLDGFATRYPRQLSGGQKQRVALARAVVIQPEILLLDEPLGALDLKLREELQVEIKAIQKRLGTTTLFVTHDQKEALTMSDRVVVMRDGVVLQVDTPVNVYERPSNQYVANFVGHSNLMDAVIVDRLADGEGYVVEIAGDQRHKLQAAVATSKPFQRGEACVFGFRPEAAHLGEQHPNRLPVRVQKTTYSGDRWVVDCLGPSAQRIAISLPSGTPVPGIDATAVISWPRERTLLLKREAGDVLGGSPSPA